MPDVTSTAVSCSKPLTLFIKSPQVQWNSNKEEKELKKSRASKKKKRRFTCHITVLFKRGCLEIHARKES